ncbi:MAG: hypothetical protein QW666_03980 [Candidatus Woesearchaeota archaeon]
MRVIRYIASLGAGLLLSACATLANKEANPEAKTILEKPIESCVIQKGEAGYDFLKEAFKAKIEALPADKKDKTITFELDGKVAKAYEEKTGVTRFQQGDEELFTEPFGPEGILKLSREDIQQHIAAYNKFIDNVYSDGKITPEERNNIAELVNSTIKNIQSPENSNPSSQIVLRTLLKKLDDQLSQYARNATREYFLAVGLVGGQDIGLTGNPQKIDVPDADVKAKLGEETYKKVEEQAKKHGLSAYTPIPQKSDFSNREEELNKARGEWTEITLAQAKALVDTNKVGDGSSTRLSQDRWTGLTDGKFENREILPGATYIQVVTTGASADEKAKEEAKFGEYKAK